MSSDESLEVINDDNLEDIVFVTEDGIRQGPDGEVMGITHLAAGIIKRGGSSLVELKLVPFLVI